MSKRTAVFLFSVLFIISTLACGLENIQVVEQPKLELTITAQAQLIQQGGQPPAVDPAPQVIVVTATPDAALAAPTAQVSTATVTTGPVTVTVSKATNCRLGPGQDFKDVYALSPGQTAEVVAKNTLNNYWIINIPDSSGKTCWLWGQYATVSGDTALLTDVPTPTPSGGEKPFPPTITTSKVTCKNMGSGNFEYQVRVNWTDNSKNETKFVIYSAPNYQTYTKKTDAVTVDFIEILPSGTKMTVVVVAANAAGESSPSSVSFVCP